MKCEHKYRKVEKVNNCIHERKQICVDCGLFIKWMSKNTEASETLNVPYEEKDEAKKLGAKWDPHNKVWYAPNSKKAEILHRWRVK
jgi:hypothetical protein